VLSANQCVTKGNLPSWITGGKKHDEGVISEGRHEVNGSSSHSAGAKLRRKSTIQDDGMEIVLPGVDDEDVSPNTTPQEKARPKADLSEFVCRGGSCVISPLGEVLAGPLWDDENGLLVVDLDFEDCLRGRLDLDVGGSYSRSDAFKLTVEGLDLSPPP